MQLYLLLGSIKAKSRKDAAAKKKTKKKNANTDKAKAAVLHKEKVCNMFLLLLLHVLESSDEFFF